MEIFYKYVSCNSLESSLPPQAVRELDCGLIVDRKTFDLTQCVSSEGAHFFKELGSDDSLTPLREFSDSLPH